MIRIEGSESNIKQTDPKQQFFTITWGEEHPTGQVQSQDLCGTDAYWFLCGYLSREWSRDPKITLSIAADIMNQAVDEGTVQYNNN